jgi:hypothetical protein
MEFDPIPHNLLATLEEYHPGTHLHYSMAFSEFDSPQDCYNIMNEEDPQLVADCRTAV